MQFGITRNGIIPLAFLYNIKIEVITIFIMEVIIMNNYEELDQLHENAKMLSGGNRWGYLTIMIVELIVSCILTVIIKVKTFIKSLFSN